LWYVALNIISRQNSLYCRLISTFSRLSYDANSRSRFASSTPALVLALRGGAGPDNTRALLRGATACSQSREAHAVLSVRSRSRHAFLPTSPRDRQLRRYLTLIKSFAPLLRDEEGASRFALCDVCLNALCVLLSGVEAGLRHCPVTPPASLHLPSKCAPRPPVSRLRFEFRMRTSRATSRFEEVFEPLASETLMRRAAESALLANMHQSLEILVQLLTAPRTLTFLLVAARIRQGPRALLLQSCPPPPGVSFPSADCCRSMERSAEAPRRGALVGRHAGDAVPLPLPPDLPPVLLRRRERYESFG
jgi:hypothetical protein